ncbi:MAG: ABC-2 family transporter protein [Verrucomicrobiota bacterium]|jgi:ABC-2 type transport system permease protein
MKDEELKAGQQSTELRDTGAVTAEVRGAGRPASGTPHPAARLAHQATRYASIYAALWKNSVTREMTFKGNFLLWILVELLWFALQISFISVLYLHTDHIGTWTKWQVVLLVGASHFIQQLFQAFFLINCTNLSELVRSGKLDFLLLLPVNSRFVVSFRQVDLGAYVNAASAVGVMVYAARQLHVLPTPMQMAGFLVLCVAGVTIHYSLMFLLASISFWTVRAQGIVWGYYNLFNIARLPDEAFHGLFKALFTLAIPMLLVSNVPARVLAHKLNSAQPVLLLLLMSLVCFCVSEWGWRASLRRYTSASA